MDGQETDGALPRVAQDIVSQVNPHVVAMLLKEDSKDGGFRRLQSGLFSGVLHRLRSLAKLRLLPSMYGSDLSQAAAVTLMQRPCDGQATVMFM